MTYLEAIAIAYLAAPPDSVEEDLLADALTAACERLGADYNGTLESVTDKLRSAATMAREVARAAEALLREHAEDEPEDEPPSCECDNTHDQNDTVCRWCWARGRRKPSDPDVESNA